MAYDLWRCKNSLNPAWGRGRGQSDGRLDEGVQVGGRGFGSIGFLWRRRNVLATLIKRINSISLTGSDGSDLNETLGSDMHEVGLAGSDMHGVGLAGIYY